MKTQSYHFRALLVVILACFAITASQASNSRASASTTSMAAPSKNAGLLTIRRAPKFGTRVRLNVSVDGKQVASLGEGESYNGALSPGKHVISVNVTPGRGRSGTATKHLTVQGGQTYRITASWSSDRVVLTYAVIQRGRFGAHPPVAGVQIAERMLMFRPALSH